MKKKTRLKIIHKKESELPPPDSTDEMVNAIHDELSKIVEILEAEFAKPLVEEEEE